MSAGLAGNIAHQAVIAAVPLVLAGVGELVAERAGVIDVGIEGLMLTGCITAYAVAAMTGSGVAGLAAAAGTSAALAGIFAVATIKARVDQIVAGMAINLIAFGASGTVWQVLQTRHDGLYAQLPDSAGFQPLLFGQYGLAYATAALAALAWWMLRGTRAGLIVRALGDAPEACAASGIGVVQWRIACVIAAGACAGAAGAYLSIMRVHAFEPGMTGGSGFLVLALVIFGRWSVPGLIGGCLFFGMLVSVQQHLQSAGQNSRFPYQLFQALPYVTALLALALLSRSAPGPARLGEPWPQRR